MISVYVYKTELLFLNLLRRCLGFNAAELPKPMIMGSMERRVKTSNDML